MKQSYLSTAYEEERDGFLLSTDPDKLQIETIHRFLAEESYWWKPEDISPEKVRRFADHSLCVGVYALDGDTMVQVAFARAVTDCTTYAYLADVFVLSNHRGQGLAKWMMTALLAHPEMQGFRRWSLSTADAQGLYAPFGFEVDATPEKNMIYRPWKTQ